MAVSKFVKNLFVSTAVILLAVQAAAQSTAPLQKTVEASKTKTSPSENDNKLKQDQSESTPKKQATGSGAVVESKAESAEGLRVAPVGRRDPFRPITLNVRVNVRRRENLSPLERFELGQLNLVGIIWDIKQPTALVEDLSGLGYMVKVGTPIGSNDGAVKAIYRNRIVVEEFTEDIYGVRKKIERSLNLATESR